MLTLLSSKDSAQLQSYLTEIGTALENLTQILEHAQTVAVEVDAPVRQKVVRVSDTPKSQRKTRKSRPGKRGVSVLNERKVAEIKRQLQAGGKSVAKIAAEFGVHVTTINCIKWGKTWKEVQPAASKPLEVVEIIK
jgi:hypothetical protein